MPRRSGYRVGPCGGNLLVIWTDVSERSGIVPRIWKSPRRVIGAGAYNSVSGITETLDIGEIKQDLESTIPRAHREIASRAALVPLPQAAFLLDNFAELPRATFCVTDQVARSRLA